METNTVVKETWLTRSPNEHAATITMWLGALMFGLSFLHFTNLWGASGWLLASQKSVFAGGEIWRAWSTLFAHGDVGHLFSNALLFFPLSYFLSGYFSFYFFPLFGIFVGGLVNFVVLKTLPPEVSLLGMSGVVYWMGATWTTLYLLIDRKDSLRRRIGKSLVISAALFLPQGFEPNISYLSHFLGFVAGIVSAVSYYLISRKKFNEAEIAETVIEEEEAEWASDFVEPLVSGRR